MTDLLLVSVITLAAVVAFASGRLRLDLVALMLLVTLAVTGLVTPEDAIAGFANPAVITVLAMLILGAGLTRTGATALLGRTITRLAGTGPLRALIAVMVAAAGLSAFVNNTAVVAVLLPLTVKLAHDRDISPSKFLLPLSYASMFGGTMTLIGSSTNLLVSDLAARHGLAPFSMFELGRLGVVFTAVGLLYMVVAGRFLLPGRKARRLEESYRIREYLTEIAVGRNSDFVGKRVSEIDFDAQYGVEVVEIFRGGRALPWMAGATIEAGDVLLVNGPVKRLMEFKEERGLTLRAEAKLGDEDLTAEDVVLAEAVVAPTSHVRGRSPRQLFFRQRYNLTILAIQHRGHSLRTRLADTVLSVGDTLLLQGKRVHLEELAQDRDLLIMGEVDAPVPHRDKLWLSVAIMAAVTGLAAVGLQPILITALAGVVAMVLLGCLTMQEAYESVDWAVLFLLAGVIPLGIALDRTGAAGLIAGWAVAAVGWLGPVAVVSVFYLLASVLTELMSNNATAILLAPIAVAAAGQLGLDPRPLLIAIT
ncbi:MAG TPA: SLC13 family permease, partial [Candidatus Limnocylindria bacterium]|nr:SLC13 family permease [Candidatus Limnocylindria bacterium]